MIAPCRLPGFGDEATWPECAGHEHDPNTPEMSEEVAEAQTTLEEIRGLIGVAERALERGDLKRFFGSMRQAKAYFDGMDFGVAA